MLTHLWLDARYAFRVLIKTPGITCIAVISIALGIGANTAIFSLLNELILRSLPVRNPQQLVALSLLSPDSRNGNDPLSLPMFEEIQKQQHVFSSMFAWYEVMATFESNGARYAAELNRVTGDYFSTLGVRPLLGRLITPEDSALEIAAHVAVLHYRFWQTRYNGDPAVIGETIRVNGQPVTIIGVTSKDFSGLIIDHASDVVVPLGHSGNNPSARRSLWLDVMARLKPGVSLQQARAQMNTLWPGVLIATVPEGHQGAQRARFFARRIEMESAARGRSYLMRERFSQPLRVLMGLVGLVLLIACVNLANLMLARAAARRQEHAIRVALGASSWRLMRQMLTESSMISIAGAALGMAAASWVSRALVNTMWTGLTPPTLDPGLDLRVLAFTAAAAVLTGLVFGLIPAYRVGQTHPADALKQNLRSVHGRAGALTRILVGAQVALSLVLLIGATLFVRSLDKLRTADPGFRREGVLIMQLLQQPGHEKIPNRTAYYRQLAENLSRLPGVESVSYSHMGPLLPYEFKEPVSVASSRDARLQAITDYVGPGFFQLIGMRLLAGREFDWRDNENEPRFAIISESLSRQLFPSGDPIGKKIDVGLQPDHKGMEIVGVVNSASLWKLQSHEPLAVYVPFLQESATDQPLLDVYTAGDPATLAPSVRRSLESLGYHYPMTTRTLQQRADIVLTEQQMIAILSASFGGLALLLASVGLHALMSYTVTRRISEIGIRMALGASRGSVLNLILREVMWLVLGGFAVGIPAAMVGSRFIRSMLFGIPAEDPVSTIFSAAVLAGVAICAGYLPARRAAHLEPMMALRTE
jgi:predicted permease